MEAEHYKKWKSEKNPNVSQATSFEENAKKFLGYDENPNSSYVPIDRQVQIEDLKKKTAKMFVRSDALYNPDKKAVGIFYEPNDAEGQGKDEVIDVERKSRASNTIFKPSTYGQEEFKKEIMKTTTQSEFHQGQFVGEPLDKQFNLRRTVISEYSNAKHNQTVFINPRFMSC